MQIGIVMLENTPLSGVTASAAPYLNGLYNTAAYVKLSTYHQACLPSLPNYLSISCASTQGHCNPPNTSTADQPEVFASINNIFSQIEGAGHTWKAYEEGGSLAGSPYLTDAGGGSAWPYYARRHCPAYAYSQINHSHNRVDFMDAKAADGVAAKGLVSDITNKALPDFFFISPNLVNDGHSPGSVTTADKWCSGHTTVAQSAPFPGLTALAAAMRNDGFLVVTFDSDGAGSALYALVLPGGTSSLSSTADFTATTGHFGLLKGIQDAFGLPHWTTTGGAGILDTRYTGSGEAAVTVFGSSGPSDTTAPTAPSALHTTSVGATSVALAWTASSDPDNAATALIYQVLRNGAVVGTTGAGVTAFTDGGLTGSTSYTYTVKALDPAGNVSPASAALSVTTSSPVTGARVHLGTPIHVYAAATLTSTQATALGKAYDLITVGGSADVSNLQATIAAAGAQLGWYNKGAGGANGFVEAWYAHGAAGQRLGPNSFNVYSMQMDATAQGTVSGTVYNGWKPYHAQEVKDSATALGAVYTAPFLDSLGSDFSRVVNGVAAVKPGTTTPYTSAEWAAVIWQIVPAVRAKLGTAVPWLILVNGMDRANQAQWSKADVLMNEGWFGPPTDPLGSHASWETNMQLAMDVAAAGVQPWLYMKLSNTSWTTALRAQCRGYGVASYFIAVDLSTPALFENGPSEGGPPPQIQSPTEYTQPEYAVTLGSPTETFATPDGYWKAGTTAGAPGIYGRYFTKGVALVNTDTAPHTYTLVGTGWKTIAGVAVTNLTVTVPAQSGVIYTGTPTGTAGPAVTIGAPSGVGSTTATLHGTVDPNGASTTCFFEYGTTTAYGSQSATQTIPVGTNPVAVTANLTGLPAGTVIHYRLTAQNTNGTAHSADATLTTTSTAVPVVTTTPESNLAETSVTLNGTVDPNNLATTYHFEYGEGTTYGQTTASVSAGSGGSPVTVSADLTGLTPGVTYHYRLVATNSAGTAATPDAIFGTPSAPVPTVSPVAPTQNAATLAGSIDPNGTAVTYHFAYGTTTAYGTATPDQTIAAGQTNPVDVFANVTGLQPNTTYHFALIANGAQSADGVFTTPAVTAISESYLWQTSSDSGATWQPASNAQNTSQSYQVVAGDEGKLIRCLVTAADSAGHQTTLATQALGPITTPVTGGIIYGYQWQNSADQSHWANASGIGATLDTYIIDPTDATLYLRCRVTAVNQNGSQQAFSNIIGPVQAPTSGSLVAQDEITVTVAAGGSTLEATDSIHVQVTETGGPSPYDQPWLIGTKIPAWLRVDGVEIANWARTSEYLARGLAGPSLNLREPCGCGYLYRIDGNPTAFASPAGDPAPWWDPQRPESSQFLGLIVNTITDAPVTSHTVSNLVGPFGGSVLSPAQTIGREITVSGTLVASSCAGRDFAVEWLNDRLGDPACDACGLSTIEYREVCPPSDGSYDDMGYWIAYQSGLTAGPTITPGDNFCNLTDITWTWASEVGYLYKAPKTVIPSTFLAPPDTSTTCVDFVDWFCGVGQGLQCATINPPVAGAWAAIITVTSPDGVGGIDIATYDRCPPDLTVDQPDSLMRVSGLQGTLIIDSALQIITYISPDNTIVEDGTAYIDVPVGEQLEWIEVEECDTARCVCFSQSHPCSGGEHTTITVDLQYRRR